MTVLPALAFARTLCPLPLHVDAAAEMRAIGNRHTRRDQIAVDRGWTMKLSKNLRVLDLAFDVSGFGIAALEQGLAERLRHPVRLCTRPDSL